MSPPRLGRFRDRRHGREPDVQRVCAAASRCDGSSACPRSSLPSDDREPFGIPHAALIARPRWRGLETEYPSSAHVSCHRRCTGSPTPCRLQAHDSIRSAATLVSAFETNARAAQDAFCTNRFQRTSTRHVTCSRQVDMPRNRAIHGARDRFGESKMLAAGLFGVATALPSASDTASHSEHPRARYTRNA